MEQAKHKIRLNEILEKTSTHVYLHSDGRLVVDHFDFSSERDVAYILNIPPAGTELLRSLLNGNAPCSDESFLDLIKARFSGYHDFQEYLKNNEVPFEKKFDSWA